MPLLCRTIPLAAGQVVLELGCGVGNALGALRRGWQPSLLIGVDLIPGLGLGADVTALPFRDGTIDTVVDFGTLQIVGFPALQEVIRVLRPGGSLIHESRWAQALAHPLRGTRPIELGEDLGVRLPVVRHRGLWVMRERAF